ncbi:MAG: hypothetical protein DRP60_06265 [Spirochaetes bacterium]|nr:MAG: hypothetical protein DRP60_06265 [Spirochaetota bacterium]
MIILLSPTKKIDFTPSFPKVYSIETPPFRKEYEELNHQLQGFSREKLASLMGTSQKLANLSYSYIQDSFSGTAPVKPALFTYSGTVFKALNPGSLGDGPLRFARKHVRILSGQYGILSPSSGISPYRLEMKTPLKLPGNKSLTSFWKPRISEYLSDEPLILNMASGEYSAVVDKQRLNGDFITFHFKERKGGKLRTVGMYAKTARGLMLRRILGEMIIDLRILQQGETAGYRYDENLSTDSNWVFVREHIGGNQSTALISPGN